MVKNELFKPFLSDFKKLVKGLVRVFLRIKLLKTMQNNAKQCKTMQKLLKQCKSAKHSHKKVYK